MLQAVAFFAGAIAVSALVARYAPWKIAQYRFMFLELSKWEGYDPNIYDPDRIEAQVKGRTLGRRWLAATLVGSALVGGFAFVMPTSASLAVYLLIAGVVIIVGYSSWQAVKLFDIGAAELGIQWPPYDPASYQIGEARFDTRNPEDR